MTKKFEEFTRDELWNLRGQICLTSCYIADYTNNFGLSANSMCTFFDSYADFLEGEMVADGKNRDDFYNLLDDYDTPENLWEWFNCCDDYSWVEYEEELEEIDPIKEFCVKLAKWFVSDPEDIDNLSSDFEWLVECGEINAEYGYRPKWLLDHNETANELLDHFGGSIIDAILGCSTIGWYKCAEDEDGMNEQMKKTLNKYEK